TVTRCMIHGPCGILAPNATCMQNDACSKNYPKHFIDITTEDKNGYPLYRRRDNEHTIQLRSCTLNN
ncbi:6972_t:CDS:1, partial [Dentiscutata heterogama]